MSNQKLLIVVNIASFFMSHRYRVAVAAQADGFEVHVATPPGEAVQDIVKAGFIYHEIPLTRSGKNPISEMRTLLALVALFRDVRPDIVHLVTIKPVLYGGLAAKIARVPAVVAAISGLGSAFTGTGFRSRAVLQAVKCLYRLALSHTRVKVIFQNSNDKETLIGLGALSDSNAVLIKGSGVDLSEFRVQELHDGEPVVIFAARLLREKGVAEYVEAAGALKAKGLNAEFWLVGSADKGNPTTVTEDDLEKWRREGNVKLLGHRSDIAQLFAQSSLVVLPSYYGEGLPKVLIEAAACGRAVVTTDHPGCRDAIIAGKTGLLVPVRDATALAHAVEHALSRPDLLRRMGLEARKFAEAEFSIETVVKSHLQIYRELMNGYV